MAGPKLRDYDGAGEGRRGKGARGGAEKEKADPKNRNRHTFRGAQRAVGWVQHAPTEEAQQSHIHPHTAPEGTQRDKKVEVGRDGAGGGT